MYMKLIVLLPSLFSIFAFLSVCDAQVIVNIERKRIITDTVGWAGSADLGFQLSKNVEKQFALSSSAHLQYKTDKSLYLLLGNISLVEAGGERFVNAGFAHFRYNRKIGKTLRWEAFTQYQYNTVLQVDQRILVGMGPRFKLLSNDKFKLYIGTLGMYEHEEILSPEATHDDYRLSTYVSSNWQPTSSVSMSSTWYYQPLFNDFSDHRFAGIIKLGFSITEKLEFTTSFNYLKDSNPPLEVPSEVYSMANGLSYSF